MAGFEGKLGLQFVVHLANRYTAKQVVELAELAHRRGFERIWINANARYRSQIVLLSAIAARVPIGIGTAILVPYLHHPIEVVDSLATLSELADGREIGFGLYLGPSRWCGSWLCSCRGRWLADGFLMETSRYFVNTFV